MSSFDRLVDMIEEKNELAIPLTRNNISFENLTGDVETDWNSRVTVRAIQGQDYAGHVQVYYTRVNLTALGLPLEFMQEAPFTLQSLLDRINETKNAQMTPEDLTIAELPSMETGVVKTFTISASKSSLVWLGNTQVSLLTGIPAEAKGLATFLNVTLPALFA